MSEDRRRYGAKMLSVGFWLSMLLLSVLLLDLAFDFQLIAVWGLCFGVVFAVLTGSRIRKFNSVSENLLSQGQELSKYDYKTQHRKVMLILALAVVVIIAPFALAGALGAAIWFGSILGLTDGWVGQLAVYNIYLRVWERKYHGELYSLNVWSGTKVTHTGLQFSREMSNT